MNEFEEITILLVEDSALDAELMLRSLEHHKIANSINWVKDGQEAIDYVFRRGSYEGRGGGDPRLILLDLRMPRVGGIEVTRVLKSSDLTKHIPIVIMTSSKEESDIAATYNLGANSYIVKPLDFDAFAEVARQAGYYWLAVNRFPT